MGKIYQALEKSKMNNPESLEMSESHIIAPDVTDPNLTDPNFTEPNVTEPNFIESGEPNIISQDQDTGHYPTDSNMQTPDDIDPSLVSILNPESPEAEQFRLLKNNIIFPEKGMPSRSIMITSPSPDEGKSFVAANLAASIAKSIDEHVLLIDCDLRSPTIHKMFGIDKSLPGLSDYLSKAKPLSSLLLKTFINKLTILPGGHIPRNPSELLSSEQMRRLLVEVKSRYSDRYIIIDTPPPYITSETNALARHVDGIILIIRQGKTRKKEVQNIIDIYGKDKIIGVVQNFAKKRPGYGYGYYKYGYGYGK